MLEVANLEVVYNDVVAVLRGLSLRVPDGQIVALLGSNGAGKTTTVRAISGLLPVHDGEITKGSITWNGERLAGRDPADIVLTVTREAPLPRTGEESAQWVEELRRWADEGVSYFLLDFGHVTSTELVRRFAEEVMAPLRAG